MIKDLTPVVAIMIIGALVGFALYLGYDTGILTGGCTVIGSLVGWTGKTAWQRRQGNKLPGRKKR